MFAYCGNDPVNRVDHSGAVDEDALDAPEMSNYERLLAAAGIAVAAALLISATQNVGAIPITTAPTTLLFDPEVWEKVKAKEEVVPALYKPPAKDPVHHIVAKADPRVAEARQILRDVGIEPVTDLRNLVVLPQGCHASLHTSAYHNYVTERL